MKTIMATYPGFQTLPKGIKQLLMASESCFFDDFHSQTADLKTRAKQPSWTVKRLADFEVRNKELEIAA